MHFDILNRLGKAHECASQTGGQTDRTTYSNSAVQRRAHKKIKREQMERYRCNFPKIFSPPFSVSSRQDMCASSHLHVTPSSTKSSLLPSRRCEPISV